FKTVTVMAAATVLSLGVASSAAAQSLGAASGAKPAPPPQVTGSQLQAVLLPPPPLGAGFTFVSSLDTGHKLATTHAKYHVSGLSCVAWETKVYSGFLGDTAGADTEFSNPNPRPSYPETLIGGYEDVLQFATTASATSMYNQARAKYAACT